MTSVTAFKAKTERYVYVEAGVFGESEVIVEPVWERPQPADRHHPEEGGWIITGLFLDLKTGKHYDITDLYGNPSYRKLTSAVDEEFAA